MKIIWHGTAAVEYVCDVGRILFDPFVPLRGAIHQTDLSEYDGFTDILVTHGHFDHIANIPEIVERNPDIQIQCSSTPYNTLQKRGVPTDNLKLLHFGDELSVSGFEILLMHGKHATLPKATAQRLKNILLSRNAGNIPYIVCENRRCQENDETILYVIRAEDKTVCHMGSMNLRDDIDYPIGCDVLLLPYNGWDDNFPPAKAIIEKLKPKHVLIHHFDNTFPPITSEPNLEPLLKEYGDLIIVPDYNKPIEL